MQQNRTTGLLLALDGVDGSGKDTQRDKLYNFLIESNKDVLCVKAPYDKGLGGILRRLALAQPVIGYSIVWEHINGLSAEAPKGSMRFTGSFTTDAVPDALVIRWLLFTEYLNTYRTIVKSALEQNKTVLLNRSHFLSNYAYGISSGLEKTDLNIIIDLQDRYTRRPDLAIILDVPYKVAQKRISFRKLGGGEITHYDIVDESTFNIRRDAYHELADRWPDWVKIVDGTGTENEVWTGVWNAYNTFLEEDNLKISGLE